MFYIYLYKEKHETSSCLKPYGLELCYFGMLHHLVDLYQVLPNYALGDKLPCAMCRQERGQLSTDPLCMLLTKLRWAL